MLVTERVFTTPHRDLDASHSPATSKPLETKKKGQPNSLITFVWIENKLKD
jgi:hypothetical protein